MGTVAYQRHQIDIVKSVNRRRMSLAVDSPSGLWLNPVNPGDEGGIVEISMREASASWPPTVGKGLLFNEARGRSRSFPYFMKRQLP